MSAGPDPIETWARPYHEPSGTKASVLWVAWFAAPPELRLSASKHGLPRRDLAGLEITNAASPGWLGNWLSGPIGTHFDMTPGLERATIEACHCGIVVSGTLDDPSHLAHIQTGMGVAKALAEAGAAAILDVYGFRWWSPESLRALDPRRQFLITEHVSVTIETQEEPRGTGHLCHTRGMRKFARPEIFARGLTPDDAEPFGAFLWEVANRMALGKAYGASSIVRIRPPGAALPDVGFIEYDDDSDSDACPAHGLARQMFLNASLEIVDCDEQIGAPGSSCEGLLSALRRHPTWPRISDA